jgi:peroxiredoxin Q/BCP
LLLAEGDTLPTLTLLDDSGKSVSTRDLLGRYLVLWFYPKDDTPG